MSGYLEVRIQVWASKGRVTVLFDSTKAKKVRTRMLKRGRDVI